MLMRHFSLYVATLVVIGMGTVGCNTKPAPPAGSGATTATKGTTKGKSSYSKFKPIDLGPGDGTSTLASTPPAAATGNPEDNASAVIATLQPFNVLLGQWRGVTRKKFEGFSKVDESEWRWDFSSDRAQPSIAFESDKSPYFSKGRITYVVASKQFRMYLVSSDEVQRTFNGSWTETGEPQQTIDGKKVEHSFKLQFTQDSPTDGEQWQIVLNLQENNRFVWDISKKLPQGSRFIALDTVGVQREGTNFAAADIDNPGPKCIVSGGLGTSTVNYKGKAYPVCCSGCADAFRAEPERWLAKAAKDEAAKKTN